MQTELTFIGIIAAFIAATVLLGLRVRNTEHKALCKKLDESFGKTPLKKIPQERSAGIQGYYRHHLKKHVIDDITWNDLDMDAVYKRIDSACSCAGEEYLYFMLRTPDLSEAGKDSVSNALINYYEEDSSRKERIETQCILTCLGTTGKYSLYDYLDRLKELKEGSRSQYLAILDIAVSLFAMFINVPAGIAALIICLLINMITYFRQAGRIEPYLICFRYILRLIDCSGKLINTKAGEIYGKDTIKKDLDLLAGFKRGSSLVMSASSKGSSNPLDIILDYVRIIFHLDLIKFSSMLKTVRNNKAAIDDMIRFVGITDAAIAVASFRKSLPYYCVPEFVNKSAVPQKENEELFCAQGLYHPLLNSPVSNDINAGRPVLLTGSNASGKSTFLKACALCAVLGETIGTCCAAVYRSPFYYVYSSMALRDNMKDGDSYFMVEIKSLKRIFDAADTEPVLCFIDEVLKGTNTIERIAASTEILNELTQKKGLMCFAATHDIELTQLLDGNYENYHFEEEIKDNDVQFSYRLHKGKALTKNAIMLLSKIGFDEKLTSKAAERALNFENTGKWNYD